MADIIGAYPGSPMFNADIEQMKKDKQKALMPPSTHVHHEGVNIHQQPSTGPFNWFTKSWRFPGRPSMEVD